NRRDDGGADLLDHRLGEGVDRRAIELQPGDARLGAPTDSGRGHAQLPSAFMAWRCAAIRPGTRSGSVRPQPHSLDRPKPCTTLRAAVARSMSPRWSSKWIRPR